jgi:hypothetical protein
MVQGILSIYNQELAQKERKAQQLPAGDERAKRLEIVQKIRDLIIKVENCFERRGHIRTKMIDEIELWMSRI